MSAIFIYQRLYTKNEQSGGYTTTAAFNKWLRNHAPDGCVVHSFRHSMRDRLRAIECPFDVIDQLGGWSTVGVGSSYGNGYTLAVLDSWMQLIE